MFVTKPRLFLKYVFENRFVETVQAAGANLESEIGLFGGRISGRATNPMRFGRSGADGEKRH